MKRKINKFYHDKAVQAGEQYGACLAEMFMHPRDSAEYILWRQRAEAAYNELSLHAAKARNFIHTPDYES